MSGVDSDLIRGHIDTIILKVLSEGDKYGYEICKDVEEKSGGTYELKQPTLYSCLKRLESQGLISSYWEDSDIGGKRHYYKLTDEGKEAYRKNQEDWLRSRQIIDNLISNSHDIATSYSLVKKDEIDELEKKAELAEELSELIQEGETSEYKPQNVEEQVDEIEKVAAIQTEESVVDNQVLENNSAETNEENLPIESEETKLEQVVTFSESVNFDDEEEIIPWSFNDNLESEQEASIEEPRISEVKEEDSAEEVYYWYKFVDMSNESEKILVEVAPNGEETAAYVENIEYVEKSEDVEDSQENEVLAEANEELSPAQSSIFEDEDVAFAEDVEDVSYSEQSDIEESEEDVDIMSLLGHTTQEEVSYTTREFVEENQEDKIEYFEEPKIEYCEELQTEQNQEIMIEQAQEPMLEYVEKEVSEEEYSPFNFNMDDFVTKSKNSYFDSEEEVAPDYIAPTIKVEVPNEEKTDFDFDSFINKHSGEDEIYTANKDSEEKEEAEESYSTPVYHDFGANSYNYTINDDKSDEDDIYVDTSNVDDDEIYLNPTQEEKEDNDSLKLFSEDIFEENNMFEEKSSIYEDENQESEVNGFVDTEIIRPKDKEPMEFYKSTENYETLSAKFTEDEYKRKLGSLMSYTNDKEEYNIKDANYSFNNIPKDYSDLKAEFEKEGLVVRTHHKMVKESRQSRSYVESNKLNLVNSWTAFCFVAFLITLTYLIMNNYVGGGVASYNFSVKYFLIGIACLAFMPALYTLIYFINPYKKKPARYASRIYLLFAILLTVQFLLIIYCVNLQLGFYSFSQANYNHLFWIIPSLMSLYPLADAILHTIFFNSRNFHV